MIHRGILLLFSCLALPLFATGGGTVANRTTLNGILGGSATTEDFESFNFSGSTNVATLFTSSPTVLNSSSIITSALSFGTQGPNLFKPGVSYIGSGTGNGPGLQWDAPAYFGSTSQEILFDTNIITIDFTTATTAFGFDVRNFNSSSANVTIYAADDSTVLASFTGGSALTLSTTAVFFGYQDTGGIGKVVLDQAGNWSPIIDNLTFAAIPEPSSVYLLGTGLAALLLARRRSRGFPFRG